MLSWSQIMRIDFRCVDQSHLIFGGFPIPKGNSFLYQNTMNNAQSNNRMLCKIRIGQDKQIYLFTNISIHGTYLSLFS